MGEDTSLFTSGFLGATFSWWVGQIVDDSFWRDNIAPGKHEYPSEIPGWGRRYKVRIIGFHERGKGRGNFLSENFKFIRHCIFINPLGKILRLL